MKNIWLKIFALVLALVIYSIMKQEIERAEGRIVVPRTRASENESPPKTEEQKLKEAEAFQKASELKIEAAERKEERDLANKKRRDEGANAEGRKMKETPPAKPPQDVRVEKAADAAEEPTGSVDTPEVPQSEPDPYVAPAKDDSSNEPSSAGEEPPPPPKHSTPSMPSTFAGEYING